MAKKKSSTLLDNKCVSCGKVTSQYVTDDGEYYFPQCGECA